MYNNLNLNYLKYFHEIAIVKNITKASENLNISQPALTYAIKELEKSLDTKLFERNKKGVILTNAGEILFEYSINMFNSLNKTINTINNEQIEGGIIYIGSTTTNFLEPLHNAFSIFKKKYPNIHIDIVLEEISVLENRSKMGKLDIIIKNSYENIKDIEIIETFSIKDKFIASKNEFKSLENKTLSLDELLKYPFVLLSNISHGRRNFDTYIKNLGIEFKPTYEFNSYSLCKELIKNGFGIGIGNPIHYKTNDFIILNTNFELPSRTFDICFNKHSNNKYLQEFINIVKEKKG